MSIEQIKTAVDAGKRVQWSTSAYRVIKDSKGQYLIRCLINDSCIGLTNLKGDRLNGKESEFTIM